MLLICTERFFKVFVVLRFLLSGRLTYLFNCSILTGVVPDKLKIARVIPVYKKGPKVIVSNYRPISLLSIFNKILEKLIYKRLLHFLEQNHFYLMANLVLEQIFRLHMQSCS